MAGKNLSNLVAANPIRTVKIKFLTPSKNLDFGILIPRPFAGVVSLVSGGVSNSDSSFCLSVFSNCFALSASCFLSKRKFSFKILFASTTFKFIDVNLSALEILGRTFSVFGGDSAKKLLINLSHDT